MGMWITCPYSVHSCGSDRPGFLHLHFLLHKSMATQTFSCQRGIPRAQLPASTLVLKYRWTYCICQIISGNTFPGRPWPTVGKLLGRVPRMIRKCLTTYIFINKIATLGNASYEQMFLLIPVHSPVTDPLSYMTSNGDGSVLINTLFH